VADQKPSVLTSTRLPRAKGVNSLLLLKTAVANVLLGVCESFLNTRYFMQQTDGVNVLPAVEADVKTTDMGRVVTFPPITTAAAAAPSLEPTAGGVQAFIITGLSGADYVTVAGGILVAKSPELRPSLTIETIDTIQIKYSLWSGDNQRTATDNATPPNSEIQIVTPRYVVGATIFAAACSNNTGVVAVDAQSTKWIEILPSRQWGGLDS
jgi:hypothetical protein